MLYKFPALLFLMSTLTTAQTLLAPQAITDPTQIKSQSNLNVGKLSIEQLYMTRRIGGGSWSPDGNRKRRWRWNVRLEHYQRKLHRCVAGNDFRAECDVGPDKEHQLQHDCK